MIVDQSPSGATYYELGFFWTNNAQYASGGGGTGSNDAKQFVGEIQCLGVGSIFNSDTGLT